MIQNCVHHISKCGSRAHSTRRANDGGPEQTTTVSCTNLCTHMHAILSFQHFTQIRFFSLDTANTNALKTTCHRWELTHFLLHITHAVLLPFINCSGPILPFIFLGVSVCIPDLALPVLASTAHGYGNGCATSFQSWAH